MGGENRQAQPGIKRDGLLLSCMAQRRAVFSKTSQASSTLDAHAQRKQMGPVDVNGGVYTAPSKIKVFEFEFARTSCVDGASEQGSKRWWWGGGVVGPGSTRMRCRTTHT